MTLFIDVENKKLVQSLTSDRSVPAPVFMQGDNEPLEIFLLQKGGESLYEVKPLVVGTDFLRVAIARFKGYPKSLTYAAGYTLNPNGGAEVVLPLNTDFLLRKIAWKIQANLFGDIPEELKIRAIESVDFSRLKVRNTAKTLSADFEKTGFVERRMETARDRRLPMPGSILAKNYNGRKIAVRVLEKGFEFDNEHYSSLSGIARKITGTNWNGFKFFEL